MLRHDNTPTDPTGSRTGLLKNAAGGLSARRTSDALFNVPLTNREEGRLECGTLLQVHRFPTDSPAWRAEKANTMMSSKAQL